MQLDKNNQYYVITTSAKKQMFLNNLTSISNAKFINFNFLSKPYTGEIKDGAIYEVAKFFNVKPSIAQLYISNLKYITFKVDEEIENLKIIREVNSFLQTNNLISYPIINPMITKDKVLHIELDRPLKIEEQQILKLVENNFKEIIIIDESLIKSKSFSVNEFHSIEEEVLFNVLEVCRLINEENIDINKIYFANINQQYEILLWKIAKMHNLTINFNTKQSMFENFLVKEMFAAFVENKEFIEPKYDVSNEVLCKLVNKFVSIINKYRNYEFNELLIQTIKYELETTNYTKAKFNNAINVIDNDNLSINDDEILFIFDFTYGVFPKKVKDIDFLNDDEKTTLGFSTSKLINEIATQGAFNELNKIKNVYISYKSENEGKKFAISDVVELNKEAFAIKHVAIALRSKYSQTYDNLKMSQHIKPDNQYSNKFDGIKGSTELSHLSYTKMDLFFNCQYAYYLKYILKIQKGDFNIMNTFIGSVAHKFLQNVVPEKNELTKEQLQEEFELDYQLIIDEKTSQGHEIIVDEKMLFYKEKTFKILLDFYEVLRKQNTYSDYKFYSSEEEFKTKVHGINLVGDVDKILKFGDGLVVVDYKTGNPSFKSKLDYVKFGLNMQLIIYAYLVKHSPDLANYRIDGMYLQNSLAKVLDYKRGYTYQELLEKNYQLNGYTTQDLEIMFNVSKYQKDNPIIAGLNFNSDGKLSKDGQKKTFDEKHLEYWFDTFEDKVNEMIEAHEASDFVVNPKMFKSTINSCQYCQYNEICFKTANDKITLEFEEENE